VKRTIQENSGEILGRGALLSGEGGCCCCCCWREEEEGSGEGEVEEEGTEGGEERRSHLLRKADFHKGL